MLQIVLSVWVKGLLLLILCKRDGRLRLSEVSLVMLNSDHIWVWHQSAFQGTSFGLASSVDGLLRIVLNVASPSRACGSSGLCNQAVAVVDKAVVLDRTDGGDPPGGSVRHHRSVGQQAAVTAFHLLHSDSECEGPNF